jgi:hypothetical protein
MPITISQDIYDDVVAYLSWRDNEVFGIEIYNRNIANNQRHFFEKLWKQALVKPPVAADTQNM